MIPTRISSSLGWLAWIAVLAIGVGCGGPQPSGSRAPSVSSPNASAAPGQATCPEALATIVPPDLRFFDRAIVPAGNAPGGVRVQFRGLGSRELTILSGVAGELPGTDTGRRGTVRGHEAMVASPGPDTVVVRWREAEELAPCSQYAIVATGLTQPELDAVISGVR